MNANANAKKESKEIEEKPSKKTIIEKIVWKSLYFG
jgi:hypothetical protein